MNLDVIERADPRAADGILAAAALASSADPGVGSRPSVLRKYHREADEVLSEIRGRLNISPDNVSSEARTSIFKVLAENLRRSILKDTKPAEVMARVGQAGQLSPALYDVVLPQEFQAMFFGLGVSSSHVVDAVKHPDDFQHLLGERLPESHQQDISLFMKRVISRDPRKSHWLLVQAHRQGKSQNVRSAWQIFPDDVDFRGAHEPIHMLKAFVNVYGVPLRIGSRTAIFFDSESFPIGTAVQFDWSAARGGDHFFSASHANNTSTGLVTYGVGYCIDLPKYRAALKKHSVKVVDPPPGGVRQTFLSHVGS